jgi:hypothetical protein
MQINCEFFLASRTCYCLVAANLNVKERRFLLVVGLPPLPHFYNPILSTLPEELVEAPDV